jgi:hypothetical protein
MERKRERLWLSHCLLILLPQIPLVDAVFDEVPGEDLILPFFSIYPEVGVDVGVLQGRGSVAVGLMDPQKNLSQLKWEKK